MMDKILSNVHIHFDGEEYVSGNRLLDSLPANELADLGLTVTKLRAHESTHSKGKTMHHVDFPIDAVLSVVATLKNGDTIEVGTTGNESFVQSESALETEFSARASFCQVKGSVARTKIETFTQCLKTREVFATAVRRNLGAVLFSSQQFTACNGKHTTLERCARWLAMTADRAGGPQFNLAHEFLAIMLGVRPESELEAFGKLQQIGAIQYDRGKITILDSGLLVRASCECYEAVRDAFARSLSSA